MVADAQDLPPLLGESRSFLDLMDRVSQVASLDRPVLVIGERGSGKELVASRIHYLSKRWDRPFVKLNCAALPETLIETELFGHEAGAFTGAGGRRVGRFELADTGSLFLDEIANSSQQAQEKVLRVIEYGEFERVGSNKTLTTDVRLIAATNIDLPHAADEGRFRHDLLDRLAFDVLTIPPLRARLDDIMVLGDHYARAIAHELGWEEYSGFSEEAVERLNSYQWPGNIRELKNVVERSIYRSYHKLNDNQPDAQVAEIIFDPFDSPWRPSEEVLGSIDTAVPEAIAQPPAQQPADEVDLSEPLDFKEAISDTERKLLQGALKENRFNQTATAKHLGLTYHQLRHHLKKHDLLGGDSGESAKAPDDG